MWLNRDQARRLAEVAGQLGVPTDGAAVSPAALVEALERAAAARTAELSAELMNLARTEASLDALSEGVVLCNEHGREIYRNRSARAFVGARHADALVEQAIKDVLARAASGTPVQRELEVLGPPRRIFELVAQPLDDPAGHVGTLAVVEDVTERRRLEAVRRDFVANISHELKTPVGALGLLAETIVNEDDPEVVQRLAARMSGESIRVGAIIDDLLALARIEAEEHPRHDTVRVDQLVAEAAERIASLLEARHTGIDVTGVDPRHSVSGDRRQLVSAVANLLENACKYGDEGSIIEISSSKDGSWVALDVRDLGIGIPTRDIERVFERFYRVDRARSRGTGGTGLGLAIVRHIATNHGGEVSVRSVEGEGSTFTLRLPESHRSGALVEMAGSPDLNDAIGA